MVMPTHMAIETDSVTGATYCALADAPVATTHHVSALVLIDLDPTGDVVGVEFAAGLAAVPDEEWRALLDAVPSHAADFRTLR